ncbi:MAG: hypothetical protein RL330_317 [Actinomycetota bacterium]
MAKDDIDPEDIEGLEIEETDPDLIDDLEEGEEFLEGDVDAVEDDDDDDADESALDEPVPARGRTAPEDDDDDVVAPDDVEEDLAEILKDRLASEEIPAEDEETEEVDDKTSSEDALQPKRADEVMCTSCFLLVRKNAPSCPVGDEACPVFAAAPPKKRKK